MIEELSFHWENVVVRINLSCRNFQRLVHFGFEFTSDYGFSVLDLNISLLYPLRIATLPRFQGSPLSDTGMTILGVVSISLKVY